MAVQLHTMYHKTTIQQILHSVAVQLHTMYLTNQHGTGILMTTGTMKDNGSVKTGMYLAIGRLYTDMADCERWLVDRTHVASWLVDPSPAHVRGEGGVRCDGRAVCRVMR